MQTWTQQDIDKFIWILSLGGAQTNPSQDNKNKDWQELIPLLSFVLPKRQSKNSERHSAEGILLCVETETERNRKDRTRGAHGLHGWGLCWKSYFRGQRSGPCILVTSPSITSTCAGIFYHLCVWLSSKVSHNACNLGHREQQKWRKVDTSKYWHPSLHKSL